MIEFVPYEKKHLENFEYCGVEVGIYQGRDLKTMVDWYATNGLAMTGIDENGVLGFGGITPISPGVAMSWVVVNPEIKQYGFTVFEAIKEKEIEFAKQLNIHRLQTQAIASSRISCKLIEMQGYEKEGVMRAYGPAREDFILYSKILE